MRTSAPRALMPWWARILLAAVAGATIGDAVLGVHEGTAVDQSARLLSGMSGS